MRFRGTCLSRELLFRSETCNTAIHSNMSPFAEGPINSVIDAPGWLSSWERKYAVNCTRVPAYNWIRVGTWCIPALLGLMWATAPITYQCAPIKVQSRVRRFECFTADYSV